MNTALSRHTIPSHPQSNRQSMKHFLLVILFALPTLVFAEDAMLPKDLPAFLEMHCAGCHDADEKSGGLDLESLSYRRDDRKKFATWVKIFDRVQAGEMPPEEEERPETEALTAFLGGLGDMLRAHEREIVARDGRSVRRRLNRYEYENSLRDLLSLPNLAVRDSIPEDSVAYGFNKVGEALDVSHVHLSSYLGAAQKALRAAVVPQIAPPETRDARYHTWDQPGFIKISGPQLRKTFPVVGLELQRDLVAKGSPRDGHPRPKLQASTDPVRREQEAVAMLMSTYEPASPHAMDQQDFF